MEQLQNARLRLRTEIQRLRDAWQGFGRITFNLAVSGVGAIREKAKDAHPNFDSR